MTAPSGLVSVTCILYSCVVCLRVHVGDGGSCIRVYVLLESWLLLVLLHSSYFFRLYYFSILTWLNRFLVPKLLQTPSASWVCKKMGSKSCILQCFKGSNLRSITKLHYFLTVRQNVEGRPTAMMAAQCLDMLWIPSSFSLVFFVVAAYGSNNGTWKLLCIIHCEDL